MRTKISSKAIDIIIPEKFDRKNYDHVFSRWLSGKDDLAHLMIMRMAVQDGNKLIIHHVRTYSDKYDMIINLVPEWEEHVKPEIKTQFDINYLVGVRYSESQQKELEQSRDELIQYLYDFFHKHYDGIAIMEKIKQKRRAEDIKM
jgi:hypothetical protein